MLLGGAVHIIGNVTKNADNSIKLEPINDCSGVTFYKGIYHVWHQCCQNHWDHVGATRAHFLFGGVHRFRRLSTGLFACLLLGRFTGEAVPAICAGDQQGPDPLAATAASDPAGHSQDVGWFHLNAQC